MKLITKIKHYCQSLNFLSWDDERWENCIKTLSHSWFIYIYPTPSRWVGSYTRSIFQQSTAGLNSKFTFYIGCLTKAKETSLIYYFSRTGGRTDGFIPLARAFTQSEMQTASSRIWTWVTNLIFYDNNLYTKRTSSHS